MKKFEFAFMRWELSGSDKLDPSETTKHWFELHFYIISSHHQHFALYKGLYSETLAEVTENESDFHRSLSTVREEEGEEQFRNLQWYAMVNLRQEMESVAFRQLAIIGQRGWELVTIIDQGEENGLGELDSKVLSTLSITARLAYYFQRELTE